jgi:hypothetical protein
LVDFSIVDLYKNASLLKIWKENDKINCNINYEIFYEHLKEEYHIIKELNNGLKEYFKSKDLGLNTEKDKDFWKKRIKKHFGNVDVEVALKTDGTIGFHLPHIFDTVGIEYDFDWSIASIRKDFRIFHSLVLEQNEPIILPISSITEESKHTLLDILIDEFSDIAITDSNIQSLFDKYIMKRLTENNIFLASIQNNEQVTEIIGSQKSIFNPSDIVVDFLKEKNIFLNGVKYEKGVMIYFGPLNKIFSEFGIKYFESYVANRMWGSLSEIEFPEFFDNSNSALLTRNVDVNEKQSLSSEFLQFIDKKDYPKNFVNRWIKNFGIGDKLDFSLNENSLSAFIIKGNERINMLDEGFGISKIIPLLIKILNFASTKKDDFFGPNPAAMILEEPEIGLHPKLQSLLAEMILDAYNTLKVQFIIETHSEYFIRKLQVLTVNKELSPNQIQIYYFHHPDTIPEGELQCYPINIDSTGALSKNFGIGFFDESSNLNIALYQFARNNNN